MAAFNQDLTLSRSASSLPKLFGLPNLDSTYGAFLVGAFAGLVSYGVLIHQVYRYVSICRSDKAINKAFVLSILVMDTIDTTAVVHACYTYLVSNYLRPTMLLRTIWSVKILPILAGTTIVICQSFFARRVYLLSKKHRLLVALSVSLMLVMFGFAVVGTVVTFEFQTYAEAQRFVWIDSGACVAAIASDSLTAGVLIFSLARQRTAYKKTKNVLNTLILYTINTGLLTGIVNTLALVFALALSGNMIWIAVQFFSIKMYTNSVLAVLNSRQSLGGASENTVPQAQDLELEVQSAPLPGRNYGRNESGPAPSTSTSGTPLSSLDGRPSDSVIHIA
ncbi:hypothetical protein L226DRAFT_616161 [Lentinus tigrinus ALCF2SS1-7]|uniref:uncharacterized protein n=1 Tax=Lentinus tigrinus ALCF2SS1-7 TaxID=1328758 RepID=UPI001165CACD|nr:hypothetical protein L226DRAFT_616161 [Lentinus tigrinus ALCF2SS1-7]